MIWITGLFAISGMLYFSQKLDAMPKAIQWIMAGTIVLILLSLIQFFGIVLGIATIWPLLVLFAFFVIKLVRRGKTAPFLNLGLSESTLLWLILIGLAVNSYQKYVTPWGGWDAIAIWNQHAKFLTEHQNWTLMFAKSLGSSHPDYPLFLPSLIAFAWTCGDQLHFIMPMIIGLIPLLGIITLLYFATENRLLGVLGVGMILIDKEFINQSSAQYADTWLAFFIAMGVYLLIKLPRKGAQVILTGFLISASCWVKNEGLIFYMLISIGVLFELRKDKVHFAKYILGGLPVLMTLILFKSIWTPPNDMVSESNSSLVTKLITTERYKMIFLFTLKTIQSSFVLLPGMVVVSLAFFKIWPSKLIRSIVILGVLFAVYLGIYVITPKDLTWHLETSFYRLVHQIYPGILLCFILLLENNLDAFQNRKVI